MGWLHGKATEGSGGSPERRPAGQTQDVMPGLRALGRHMASPRDRSSAGSTSSITLSRVTEQGSVWEARMSFEICNTSASGSVKGGESLLLMSQYQVCPRTSC